MEPTYYISPQGNRQLVSTPTEAVRLKYRGWSPEAKPEPAPEPVPASVVALPKTSKKKPKAPKPAA